MRGVGDVALRRSPAQLVSRRFASHRLAVLAYHGIDDPVRFDRQVDWLTRHAWPVTLDEVLTALGQGRPMPPRAVLVTFDDGHRSVLEHGLPLLQARGVPAVVFVLAGLLDSDRPFWWTEVDRLVRAGAPLVERDPATVVRVLKQVPDDVRRAEIAALRGTVATDVRQAQLTRSEVRAMAAAGFEIGNHTWTHPCLDRCATEVVRREIEAAHEDLTEVLGHAPRAFAYPNGNWDARAEAFLERLGYRAAFLFDHRMVRPSDAHPLRLSRLRVNSDTSIDRLTTIVSGLHPAVHHARARA